MSVPTWLIRKLADVAIKTDIKEVPVKDLYEKFDANNDGRFDKEELSNIINGTLKKSAGKFCKQFDINTKNIMKIIDISGKKGQPDGYISFSELDYYLTKKSGVGLKGNAETPFGEFVDKFIEGMGKVKKEKKQ